MISPITCTTSSKVLSTGLDGDYKFYCQLFDDMVFKGLCVLRRQELSGRDSFSCAGCSKDTFMNTRAAVHHAADRR
jgi:hypothetical protein